MKKKRNMAKRIFSFLLAAVLSISLLPGAMVNVEAALSPEVDDVIAVKEITVSPSTVELTDEVLSEDVIITVKLSGNTEEVPYIYVRFSDLSSSVLLRTEDESVYEGTFNAAYHRAEGDYTFTEIWMDSPENGEKVVLPYKGTAPVITIVKNNTDKTAPVVENIILKNGNAEVASGSILKKSDTLDIYVKVEENAQTKNVSLDLRTSLSSANPSSKYVSLTYDEASGYYVGSVDLSELAATEWYVEFVTTQDAYSNDGHYQFRDVYFYVTEEDGSCSIPEFTYDVNILTGNYWTTYPVTSGRVTSLKELFPDGMPEVEAKEGYELIGWLFGNTLYSEEDTMYISGNGALYGYPVYDKADVTVIIEHYAENGTYVQDEIKKTVPSDTTYQEILDSVDLSVYKHNSQVTFKEWSYRMDDLDKPVYISTSYNIKAVYDKVIAILSYWYEDENHQYQSVETPLLFDEGVTYQEVADSIEMPELVHSNQRVFKGWEFSDWTLENYPEWEYETGSILYVNPIYEDKDSDESETPSEPETPEEPSEPSKPSTPEEPSEPSKPSTPSVPGGSWYYDEEIDGEEAPVQQQTPVQTPSNRPVINRPAAPEEDAKEETTTETTPAVQLDAKAVEEAVTKIAETAEGETFVVSMVKEDGSVATEVPVALLEAARGKDVDIVLDMGDYSWTINGTEIGADLSAINLEVKLDTEAVPSAIVDKLAGGEPTRQISLTHNGDFGFKAKLTVNVGSEHAGQYGNLYYHDSNNALVFMNAGQIEADGSVSLDFTHASDYVIVLGRDRTEEETVKAEVETEEAKSEEASTEVMEDVTETEEKGSSSMLIIVLVALVAGIAVVVFAMKKKSDKK